MQQSRSVEIGTGLFVLLGLAALFFLTTQTTGTESFGDDEAYTVTARFDNVGSLTDQAALRIFSMNVKILRHTSPERGAHGRQTLQARA